MEEEKKPNFNSIKHRSIESATNTHLLINISNFISKLRILSIIEIIVAIAIIFIILVLIKSIVIKYIRYILLSLGILLIIIGIILLVISKLDYIDQMYVENDDGSKENARSIGSEQKEIPSKIIINAIDEGYDEIFSGSGKPPLFTNDEVQFFNQFMKININKKQ